VDISSNVVSGLPPLRVEGIFDGKSQEKWNVVSRIVSQGLSDGIMHRLRDKAGGSCACVWSETRSVDGGAPETYYVAFNVAKAVQGIFLYWDDFLRFSTDAYTTRQKWIDTDLPGRLSPVLHELLAAELHDIWVDEGLGEFLENLMRSSRDRKRIVMCGLSHGAALAQSLALRLDLVREKLRLDHVEVLAITWSAYRWTDVAGADLFEEKLGNRSAQFVAAQTDNKDRVNRIDPIPLWDRRLTNVRPTYVLDQHGRLLEFDYQRSLNRITSCMDVEYLHNHRLAITSSLLDTMKDEHSGERIRDPLTWRVLKVARLVAKKSQDRVDGSPAAHAVSPVVGLDSSTRGVMRSLSSNGHCSASVSTAKADAGRDLLAASFAEEDVHLPPLPAPLEQRASC